MGILRAAVIFLVGAGVMMGAFLTGIAQRVPSFFSEFERSAAVESQRSDMLVVPARHEEYAQSDEYADPHRFDALRTRIVEPDYRVRDDVARGDEGRPVIAMNLESANTSGCVPVYRFVNDTGRTIAFRSEAGSLDVPPGGAASPDSAVSPADACGPVVHVRVESPH